MVRSSVGFVLPIRENIIRPLAYGNVLKKPVDLQQRIIVEHFYSSEQFFNTGIYHRQQRTFQVQTKLKENVKRLIGTIPLDDNTLLDSAINKIEIDKRQALLENCYQMVKYIDDLHRICEFTAVSAAVMIINQRNSPIVCGNLNILFSI